VTDKSLGFSECRASSLPSAQRTGSVARHAALGGGFKGATNGLIAFVEQLQPARIDLDNPMRVDLETDGRITCCRGAA
jgi:hypothetical protein